MSRATADEVLQSLAGLRCNHVDNPLGSVIRFDLGPMDHSQVDPDAGVHGWRHLTILGPWRLEAEEQVIADWNIPGCPDEALLRILRRLEGDEVVAADGAPPGWDLVVHWRSGHRLSAFGDCDEYRHEAWFIIGTDGVTISMGPVMDASRTE